MSGFDLDSGRVTIRVEGQEYVRDLMDLQDLLDEVEAANPLPSKGGYLSSTPAFRKAVCEALEKDGIPGVSGTGAWQLWVAVNDRIGELKNCMAGTPK